MLRPQRKDNIQGRSETRLAVSEEQFKDPFVALDNALSCAEIRIGGLGPSAWKGVSQWRALASSKVCGEKADLGGRLAPLGPDG